MYWRIPRSILTLLFVMLFLWIAGFWAALSAQEVPVRHYVAEVEGPDERGLMSQGHVMIGADRRAGVVLMMGPVGQEPVPGAVTGPITAYEEEEGATAFCFTADEVDGFIDETLIGLTSCFVYLPEEDVIWETGFVLWGEATNGPFVWCGEDHALNPAPDKERWSRS